MSLISQYYRLTKPGIVYSNAMAASAGYLFVGDFELTTFSGMLVGTMLVIASACVLNNVIDRDIDARMSRTAKRELPVGAIGVVAATTYGVLLLFAGVTFLALTVNYLALLVALVGHVAYVGLYTYSKRHTIHSTLIGTISGSTPPVIGYAAAAGRIDVAAGLLFLLLATWQMPHFYAIGLFRKKDYSAANLPILPVVKGFEATRRQIIVYVLAFIAAVLALSLWGGASWVFTVVVGVGALWWLKLCLERPASEEKWARRQFVFSLKLLLLFSAMLSLDGLVLRPLLHL